MTETFERYIKAYKKTKRDRQRDPAWLLCLREKAMALFTQKGFPTIKDDTWRYTDVAPILNISFDLDEKVPVLSPGTLKDLRPKNGRNFLLVVNGKFSREHSSIEEGIDVMDIEEAIAGKTELVEPYLSRSALPDEDAFYALNTALFRSGLLIHIPEDMTVKEPLYVVFLTDPAKERAMFFPRNLIVVGERK